MSFLFIIHSQNWMAIEFKPLLQFSFIARRTNCDRYVYVQSNLRYQLILSRHIHWTLISGSLPLFNENHSRRFNWLGSIIETQSVRNFFFHYTWKWINHNKIMILRQNDFIDEIVKCAPERTLHTIYNL